MLDLVSEAITRFPLLTALAVTAAAQVLFSIAAHAFLSAEWCDVLSLALAGALTRLYYLQSAQTQRQRLILACVTAWALRLGFFLAARTLHGFHDKRLDPMRSAAGARRWIAAQTAWVYLTLLPVWVGMTPKSADTALNGLDAFALAAYAGGLGIESVADAQKRGFLEHNCALPPDRKKAACDVGLFKYSRFPHYFGEWLLWTAITLLAWQAGAGWTRILLPICPWFVLKIFYSLSIPIAIKAVKGRATQEEFEAWRSISLFVPMPPLPWKT